ncbi:MAG: DUF6148 family protein [Lachnospiraceae bacterium]|nr:DUF6148 family protein [Lachnospiraceae bacterium]MCH4104279.1 DUF6148 family protein [Lachnospiraceae bacterium]MCI1309059.1 DUF6148 family protein [Lachnospiraceae bacterium]MCI1357028.1 DUF6148 family protein [Lachnospiraceae bacterium]MCI1357096.1 DUF6148 family protein [Lachnospiraceae bacterium]
MTTIERKKARLELYYAAEEAILSGAQSYTIGSRTLTRANLGTIETMIKKLEAEVGVLEDGRKPRKAFGVTPRDI